MKLAQKVALSQMVTGLIALLAIYGLVIFVWVKNYEVLEEKYAQSNVRRLEYLWQKEQTMMASSVGDWAPWDDLHAFARQPHELTFVEKNLQDAAMVNLSVDIAVVTDPTGKILFAKAVDKETKKEVPVPPELFSHIRSGQDYLRNINADKPIQGILWLKDQPLILAAQRILKSDHSGESPGILIFLRKVDDFFIKELTDVVQAPVHISRAITATHQSKADGNYIRSLTPVTDIYGLASSAIYVDTPRILTQEARKQFNYFIALMGILAILITLFSMVGMQRFLLQRLKRIEVFLTQVDISEENVKQLSMDGNDELSQVASTLNRMLEKILVDRQQIEKINRQLQKEPAQKRCCNIQTNTML
jgi:sensor domain CHASE-containing protein